MINVNYPAGKSGLIQIVDGLINEDLCQNFLSRMNQLWNLSFPGQTISGVDVKTKLTEDLHYNQNNLNGNWLDIDKKLEEQICQAITSAVAIYKQEYRHLDHWVNVQDCGFQVQKYPKSYGYYRPHVDSFPMPYSAISERVLAMVIYLNDVEYGGETNFPLHEVSVTPKTGRIVFFPATWTHPHESRVPISGDKWIISSFITNEQTNHPDQLPTEEHHDHEGHHTHEDHHSVE